MYKNRYVFDYNVIAKLDPDYRQYLTDVNQDDEADSNIETIMTTLEAPAIRRATTSDGTALTEDDIDVINLVSNTNVRPAEPTGRRGINLITEAAETPRNIPRTLYLKSEFKNPKSNGRKMCPPQFQLEPPKNVLAAGSRIYEDHKVYNVSANGLSTNPDAVILNKSSISISGDKIRYVRTSYWFDRIKNVTAEQSSRTTILVYNKKTKNLYKLYKIKTSTKPRRKRYAYRIRSVLMNYQLCGSHLALSPYIARKFIKIIERVVKQDVPDAHTPIPAARTQNFAYPLEMLVLQHKLGKRVDWIDPSLYLKISSILHAVHITSDPLSDCPNMDVTKRHVAKMRKFIPRLKKHTNYTSLIEAMFGKLYHKILLKLITYNSEVAVYTTISRHMNAKSMPKIIHHLLQATINSALPDDVKRSVLTNIYTALNNINDKERNFWIDASDRTDTWAVTALRFVKNGLQPPSTYIWRDTYEMAARYHVRVRPRKFNNPDDVQRFHDRLVAIQNRDRKVLREYKNRDFLPFTHPDKLYDGFQFIFLDTPTALVEEGVSMHHCIGGYANRCLSGKSLVFSMRKDDVGYVTVELDGSTYKVVQQYTINDNLVNNNVICGIIETWEHDVIKIHEKDEINYHDLCNSANESLTMGNEPLTLDEGVADRDGMREQIDVLRGAIPAPATW